MCNYGNLNTGRINIFNKPRCGDVFQEATDEFMKMVAVWLRVKSCTTDTNLSELRRTCYFKLDDLAARRMAHMPDSQLF